MSVIQDMRLDDPDKGREKFSEVRDSKQSVRRSGKHSTTAWWHPFSAGTLRLGSSSCTIVYQGVATRNNATTREILAHRMGTQPNFAITAFYEVRVVPCSQHARGARRKAM